MIELEQKQDISADKYIFLISETRLLLYTIYTLPIYEVLLGYHLLRRTWLCIDVTLYFSPAFLFLYLHIGIKIV